MNSKWPSVKLGEYCLKIGSGATPRGGSKVYLDAGEFTLIRSQNIYNAGFNKDGLVYITNEAAEKLKNVEVSPLDILLNITGDSVARVCIAPQEHLPARVNQHVAIVRPIPSEFDANFLRYFLTSPSMQDELLSIASSGATRNALTKGDIESLNIPKPEINTQKKISHCLLTFDNKIQLNKRINQTLEAIAQATFKSWFIDFDPVKAKMAVLDTGGTEEEANLAAMRVISSKSQSELEAFKAKNPDKYAKLYETAKLFPSEMEESELGEMPKGWDLKPLDTIAHYQNGLALQKFRPKENEGSLPVLKIAQLRLGFTEETNNERASENIKPSCIVNNGDVIFSWSATLMVKIWAGGKAALNQHLFKVTSDHFPKWFYYYFTKCHLDRFIAIAESKAVTMGHIKREHLSEAMCATPPSETLQKLGEVISTLLDKAVAVQLQSSTLAELRDTLLPRLLSGAIELPIDEECELDGVANG